MADLQVKADQIEGLAAGGGGGGSLPLFPNLGFGGDGFDGPLDVNGGGTSVIAIPAGGVGRRYTDLTIRAANIMQASLTNTWGLIGVNNRLVIEGTGSLSSDGQGFPGGLGGANNGPGAGAVGAPGTGSISPQGQYGATGGGGGGGAGLANPGTFGNTSGGPGGGFLSNPGGLAGITDTTLNGCHGILSPAGLGASFNTLANLFYWHPLISLFGGSGGGGGGQGRNQDIFAQGFGGNGGPGGGSLVMEVNELELQGNFAITTRGLAGAVGGVTLAGVGGGGGGGAAGSAVVFFKTLIGSLPASPGIATGGLGGPASFSVNCAISSGAGNAGGSGFIFFLQV